MIVTLDDGSVRKYDAPVTPKKIAADISSSIAKKTLAAYVNDILSDLQHEFSQDSHIRLVTQDSLEGLEILRHSCAHLLAMAIKKLYPNSKLAIGPVIEDGFYYDFSSSTSVTEADFKKIEKEMKNLAAQNHPIVRHETNITEARKIFSSLQESYKLEILENLPDTETISYYQQDNFLDLCRGPHVSTTSKLKHFKLTKVSGAYWRGDSKNEMLQRIYGTCWFTKQDLAAYLLHLEEAAKRDHRKIGKKLSWFHMQEEAPGIVFWHTNGWKIFTTIESYLRELLDVSGYNEVKSPQIIDKSLWEQSGHWDKFRDMMFVTNSESRNYAVKPMNCPGHIQIFNQGIRSYKDLPIRLSEFGACHRNEPSGTLHGLMRVRAFTQDDAHIFCSHEQIQQEVSSFINLVFKVYKDFGFDDILLKLSTRPEQRVGSDEVWDVAENALQQALDNAQLQWQLSKGEGAFYGPKIEFSLKDCLGRVWQCGTVQVDFSMPSRLDASYIDKNGNKQTPVMLHRAILGSFERFIGILIENYAGCLPCWLAPVQVALLPIADKHHIYIQRLYKKLQAVGIRVITDLRNEKIGFKIRNHSMHRVPYLLIVGDSELQSGCVSVRTQAGEDIGVVEIQEFINRLQAVISNKERIYSKL